MAEKKKKKKKLTNTKKKLLEALVKKANREILSETSQKEIKKEAQSRGISDVEKKDLRTKYKDLTEATGKYRNTYSPRFKKGGLVSRGTKFKGIF
jgi:hypothetical protein